MNMHFSGRRRIFSVVLLAAAVTAVLVVLPAAANSAGARLDGKGLAVPAALANAIHNRLGAGTLRSSAASYPTEPNLGLAVALSADGTTALVGAPGVGGGKGAAYIFHASEGGSWSSRSTPTATLTKRGAKTVLFGSAVALSADGTTAFVGAPRTNPSLFGADGAIYVFHVSSEDAWSASSRPKATLRAGSDAVVGISLALSSDGTTLVTGAPLRGLTGGAYVFHASSGGAWVSTSTPTATLSNAAESVDDFLVGLYVAISGDGTTVLVSDDQDPAGGGAYLYHATAADAWTSRSTPTATLRDASTDPKDVLGSALALSGDGAVALLGDYTAHSAIGLVDVFHSSGGAWTSTSTPTATLTYAGGSPNEGFGLTVAVSSDGTTALVTAPGHNIARGAAYIFRVVGEEAWTSSSAPTARLINSGGRPMDTLGVGVLSLDGATALIGAPGVKLQTGAAHVFHVADASSWVDSTTPTATLTHKALAACVVPKLKGLELSAARSALTAGRCHLGKVTKVAAKKKSHGHVLSQKYKPGKRLAIHAKVAVKVGK